MAASSGTLVSSLTGLFSKPLVVKSTSALAHDIELIWPEAFEHVDTGRGPWTVTFSGQLKPEVLNGTLRNQWVNAKFVASDRREFILTADDLQAYKPQATISGSYL